MHPYFRDAVSRITVPTPSPTLSDDVFEAESGGSGVGKIGNKYEFRSGSDPYAVKACSGVTSARTSRFERLNPKAPGSAGGYLLIREWRGLLVELLAHVLVTVAGVVVYAPVEGKRLV
jgi:hypothetical protein